MSSAAVSASSYDFDLGGGIGGGIGSHTALLRLQEGDDLRVACAMIVRKQNVRDAAKNVLKWTSKTASIVSSLELSAGQDTVEYFVQNNDDVIGFLAVLELPDVNRTLNGADLSCSAHFGVASLGLEVHYPPTFTIKRTPGFGIPVVEGMTLSLECLVDVYPQTFGFWLKDEEEADSVNGTIVLDAVGVDDAGWFQCYVIYNGEEYSSIAYFLSVKENKDKRKPHKVDSEKLPAALSSDGDIESAESLSRLAHTPRQPNKY